MNLAESLVVKLVHSVWVMLSDRQITLPAPPHLLRYPFGYCTNSFAIYTENFFPSSNC